MNKVDLKLNAIANARLYFRELLEGGTSNLMDLLDTLMDLADKDLDYDKTRDELEQLIIWKASEYLTAA